jgi:hypothetical protein
MSYVLYTRRSRLANWKKHSEYDKRSDIAPVWGELRAKSADKGIEAGVLCTERHDPPESLPRRYALERV